MNDENRVKALEQISWRFGAWYSDSEILKLAIGHLLVEIGLQIANKIDNDVLKSRLENALELFPGQIQDLRLENKTNKSNDRRIYIYTY